MQNEESKVIAPAEGLSGFGSYFGSQVDVDGTRALLAAYGTTGSGAVHVYEYDGLEWAETAVLQPSDGVDDDFFGASVSLSGDRAIIGSIRHDGSENDEGAVYVFEYDGMNWVEQQKITGQNPANGVEFGKEVSLDGDWMVVSALNESVGASNFGAVYVYHHNGIEWVFQQKLFATDVSQGNKFGRALSLEGGRLAVGATGYGSGGFNSGAVYVYTLNGMQWTDQQKLEANDAVAGDLFGFELAHEGDHLLIAALGDDDAGGESGSVYHFEFDGLSWQQEQKLTASDGGQDDEFGSAISLSGNQAFIGSHLWDGAESSVGALYAFELQSGDWVETQQLTIANAEPGDNFAFSVSFDGTHVFAGVPGEAFSRGAVHAFVWDTSSWVEVTKLIPAQGAVSHDFGVDVSISRDRMLVGAFGDRNDGNYAGAAYMYQLIGQEWVLEQKLSPANGNAGDGFGISVSLKGNRALVGSWESDHAVNNTGSAYVYEYDGSQWLLMTELVASDGGNGDDFGRAVSIDGDVAVIGAPRHEHQGDVVGAAYVFEYDGMNWVETDKWLASDGVDDAGFGAAVDIESNTVVVGAYRQENLGVASGAVYVFEKQNQSWAEQQKLTASSGGASDYFGIEVNLSGQRILIGAPLNDELGFNAGAAYVFERSNGVWSEFQKIMADNTISQDRFGSSVSLEANQLLVGNSVFNPQDPGLTSVYRFEFDGLNWVQQQSLLASDGAVFDGFGYQVSMTQNMAVIGALGDDDAGTDSGSVYSFRLRDDLIYQDGFDSL